MQKPHIPDAECRGQRRGVWRGETKCPAHIGHCTGRGSPLPSPHLLKTPPIFLSFETGRCWGQQLLPVGLYETQENHQSITRASSVLIYSMDMRGADVTATLLSRDR